MLFRLLAVAVFVLGILGIARQDAPPIDSMKAFAAVLVVTGAVWFVGGLLGPDHVKTPADRV